MFASCTKAVFLYPDQEPETGIVRINPDQSVYTLPALNYYFYGQDGGRLVSSVAGDDQGNFEGKLPAGAYRVIAGNAQATNVVYEGMDQVETARVIDKEVATATRTTASPTSPAASPTSPAASPQPSPKERENRAASYPLSFGEGRGEAVVAGRASWGEAAVYRVVVKDFRIAVGETLVLIPAPELLTHRLMLNFILDGDLQSRVSDISGALCGVYPSVDLYTGKTADEEIARSPYLQVAYTAVPGDNPAILTASLDVFGLYDPDYGKNYRNEMAFTLTLDGAPTSVEVDLTDELSKVMAYYAGNLPVNIPLKLEIELLWNGITVEGKVKPWSEESGTQIEI